MAVLLKHTTQATGTDAGTGEIRKAQWNEGHTLTIGTGKILGRTTALDGAVEEITPGSGLTFAAGAISVNFTGYLTSATAASTYAPISTTVTLTGVQTLTDKTLTEPTITGTIVEDVFSIPDAVNYMIDPSNGSVQLWTLGASRTPALPTSWTAGQSVTLMINDGTAYTITWTTMAVVWVGGAAPPLALSGYTIIQLWKVGTVIYGAYVGSVA